MKEWIPQGVRSFFFTNERIMTDKRQTVIGIGNALVDILTRIDNDDILKE